MQSEVSISKPISGTEAIESCIYALRQALARDDRFSTHAAYRGFRASIDFKFSPSMSYVPDVERSVSLTEGDVSGDFEEESSLSVEIPLRPPNQVREEAELPQPVLVTNASGESHEEWRKTSKTIPKNKVPRNRG
ncbi:MAG: hypothetical protein KGL39_19265 [Patescibacteria group bacterium]|nr:hypothetical protein [Patescibacteria group bacterium]